MKSSRPRSGRLYDVGLCFILLFIAICLFFYFANSPSELATACLCLLLVGGFISLYKETQRKEKERLEQEKKERARQAALEAEDQSKQAETQTATDRDAAGEAATAADSYDATTDLSAVFHDDRRDEERFNELVSRLMQLQEDATNDNREEICRPHSDTERKKIELISYETYLKGSINDDLYSVCLGLNLSPEENIRSRGFLAFYYDYLLTWTSSDRDYEYEEEIMRPRCAEWEIVQMAKKTTLYQYIIDTRPHYDRRGEGMIAPTFSRFSEVQRTDYFKVLVDFAYLLLNGAEPTPTQAAFIDKLRSGNYVAKSCRFLTTAQLERMNNPDKQSIRELDTLIGMESVKQEVRSLYNFIKVQQLREEEGFKAAPFSIHCVFTGNPGTGKTTVARILAGVFMELGLLPSDKLVETDRSGLVAEYIGQTAVKTNKLIDTALGGVLFIDEAYSLVNEAKNDFGAEAIATLLKRMEDDRDNLIVILAGYPEEMDTFIKSNPGLQSRFTRYIHFEDYSADELVQIFHLHLKKYELHLTEAAEERLRTVIAAAEATKDEHFGNARWVRNLFEATLQRQANRLAQHPADAKEALQTIEAADIRPL